MTIKTSEATAGELYRILSTAVAPRPICFASTISAAGQVNLSPYSFFNVVSINPPILGFSVTRRGSDNSSKDTLNNVLEVPEVVINIVEHSYVEQMSLASTQYAPGVNEFEKVALTQVPSDGVKPPRVGEAAISFECAVDQVIALGDGPIAGNLVLARVTATHLADRVLGADGKVDSELLDLVGRMGGNHYVRATEEAKFLVAKPGGPVGIGVDGLPDTVRNNPHLSGNDLGRLGGVKQLPTKEEITTMREDPRMQYALMDGEEAVVELAQKLLSDGEAEAAFRVLLA
ncbi:flavin reductase family protein [Neolewinella antarctica]|uniref:Flavin reductase (DIM6/NTAB) family NADH-FMN oxidoreductase RutF n=1 Tax=Neolewinella antarctica TaxID=442734 RepID=A0ABX0X9V7_9BACT|nr:flavin reductase family protein [Neolewinella antarctica]NJC25562.1 flavin reductase (DIM6/NTAB) family NADH-FMN oxidoreductase RutF [Neolewinella antarctica]